MDFTFAGIKDALVRKLKEYSKWSVEILTLGVYSTILDVVAFIVEKLAYYVDFLFIETTTNATLRSSVVRIAKDHGYTPVRKSGAVGYLVIGSDESFTSFYYPYTGLGLEILRWTQFQSEDGQLTVYATEDSRLNKNAVQKTLHPNPGTTSLNLGSNGVGISISGHGLQSGDKIYILGSRNFDGIWYLTDKTTESRIVIQTDYVSEIFTGLEDIRVGYAFIPVREGSPQEFTYICKGEINEKISLFSDSIEQFEIQVFKLDSNGDPTIEVEIVDDLYFVNDIEKYTCEIENFVNYDGIYIKFGDNITSRRVVQDERYLVKYSITKGSSGNIRTSGIITQSLIPFINVENGIEELFITNLEPIIGGGDLETLTQIKKQYSKFYKSGKQLTSRDAWIAAIEEKQFVYKAMVWTELDIGGGTVNLTGTSNQNVHYMTAVNTEGDALTPPQESNISLSNLIPRKSPTDIISWQKLDKIRLKFSVLAEIKNTISFADMKTTMMSTLKDNFGVLNLDFNQNVYESNYIRVLDNISGVIRHETIGYYAEEDIEVQETLKKFLVSKSSTEATDVNKVVLNTPEIWIRRKISGTWYKTVQMSETSLNTMTGVNLFSVSGTVVYTATQAPNNNQDMITYQCFDLLQNQVPSVLGTGTTTASSQILSMVDVTGLSVGMYVSGINIVSGTTITEIIPATNTLVLNQPTSDQDEGTGIVKLGWFPDMGSGFGARNPDDSEETGYILYLIYQTEDYNGNRIGDFRLTKFNQILDFSEELSTFDFVYP